ncbi:MAG: Trk family potassium uptake protein [Chloroflexi bacterium]|nr:Trk family potassium uptake protein [Chloroflexota bacterium]
MPIQNHRGTKRAKHARSLKTPPGRGLPFFAFIILGFAIVNAIGFVLLMLPPSSADGDFTNPVDALFTATSATSDTGLVTVVTATHWSSFGQGVILGLIQVGGLGFMLFSSSVILLSRRQINLHDFRFRDTLGVSNFRSFFVLFLQSVALTIVVEAVGAYLFWRHFHESGIDSSVWHSVFYSVSAFNNAGFDLNSSLSLVDYASTPYILMSVAGIVIVGGLSVPLIFEVITKHKRRKFSIDTKLALIATLFLLILGTVVIFAFERGNAGTLGALDSGAQVSNAFFSSAITRSAGFTSLDIGAMAAETLIFMMVLMFIGGVSGSTAGGIKVNTFTVLSLTAVSYIRGRSKVVAFGHRIPEVEIHRAVSVFFFSCIFILVIVLVLAVIEEASLIQTSFETVSAFSTVGLSTGITPALTTAGKLIICLTMFVGRLGPLVMIMALARPLLREEKEYPEEEVRIG